MSGFTYPTNAHTTILRLPQKFITIQRVHDLIHRTLEHNGSVMSFAELCKGLSDLSFLTPEQCEKVVKFHTEQGAPTRTAAEVVAETNVVYSF